MPLTLTVTEGVLPTEKEVEAGRRITEAFLRWHQLAGNPVMTPNVTNHLHVLPKNRTLSGGEPIEGAWIETRTPSFALADRDVQVGFFNEATNIIEELAEGAIPRDRIYANAVHTVDGSWNLDGRALTNQQIADAISAG